MALEIPLTDLARGRVQLKLSISGGNATLDIKPGSPSLVTPLHPGDLRLHLSSTKQDDHIVVSMWTTLPTPCSGTQGAADTASWDWQEEYNRTDDLYAEQQQPNMSRHEYNMQTLTSSTNYFDPVQLPTPPGELDFALASQDCQSSASFSPAEVFSFDGMGWPDYSSGFSDGPESMLQQPLSYLPPSPSSDLSEAHSSFGLALSSPMTINTGAPPAASSFSPSTSFSSSSYIPTPTLTTSSLTQDEPISSAHSDMSDSSTTAPVSPPATEGNALRPHPCLFPDCGRWFTRSYTRNVHMLTHRRSNDPKPFLCTMPGCSEGFSRKHDRLRHEVRQHGRGSNWRCPMCPMSKFYSSQSTLERHLSEKHNEAG